MKKWIIKLSEKSEPLPYLKSSDSYLEYPGRGFQWGWSPFPCDAYEINKLKDAKLIQDILQMFYDSRLKGHIKVTVKCIERKTKK